MQNPGGWDVFLTTFIPVVSTLTWDAEEPGWVSPSPLPHNEEKEHSPIQILTTGLWDSPMGEGDLPQSVLLKLFYFGQLIKSSLEQGTRHWSPICQVSAPSYREPVSGPVTIYPKQNSFNRTVLGRPTSECRICHWVHRGGKGRKRNWTWVSHIPTWVL